MLRSWHQTCWLQSYWTATDGLPMLVIMREVNTRNHKGLQMQPTDTVSHDFLQMEISKSHLRKTLEHFIPEMWACSQKAEISLHQHWLQYSVSSK